MIHMVTLLIVINVILFLAIALIRQENPFDLWVLFFLALGNVLVFAVATVLTHDSPMHALGGLAANLLPFVVAVAGIGLVILVNVNVGSSRRRHRPSSRVS